jgi:hypothetical protein
MVFDGDDIEDAHPTQIPPTIVRPAAKAGVKPAAEPAARTNIFEKKKSSKGIWIIISIIVGILGLAAGIWFIKAMAGN